MEVMDISKLEALAKGNEGGTSQFYYSGKTLKHDDGWNIILMGPGMIRKRHKRRLENKLDVAVESGESLKAIGILRDLIRLGGKTDKEMYQIALDNLTEDGHDKPKILAKLKELAK
jgi:hypothetical protein